MKKLILPIILVIIIVFGVWYIKNSSTKSVDTSVTTYKNSNLGISFTYPKIITTSTSNDTIFLHHEVPFVHNDYCDFKGESTTTIPTLTDFHVKLNIVDKNLVDTMRSISSYIPQENFVNGNVVPSSGFIDPFEIGNLKGYRIFEGAEGCGHIIYYLKVSDNKTLVVSQDLITIFTGAIDPQEQTKAEAVPGIINKENSDVLFNSILKTVVVSK